MTCSAFLPGAALRAMRTAVGRRALHLAFLVGAVFALGVLCGERAQAADGVRAGLTTAPAVPAPAQSAPHGPGPTHPAQPGPEHEDEAKGRGTGEPLVRSVGERVVIPAAGRLGGVVTDLTEAPEEALPAPSLPPRPQAPALPPLPGLTQPAPLPELPGLPAVPPDTPEPDTPEPDTPDTLPAPFTQSEAPAPPVTDTSAPTTRPEAPAAATHGPDVGGAGTGLAVDPLPHDAAEHRATLPAPHTDPTPAPHAPGGSPDGTTGSRSAADHGTPRHGDAHAVTPGHRLRVRLVPGAAASTEAAETRDRHRSVPVSPA